MQTITQRKTLDDYHSRQYRHAKGVRRIVLIVLAWYLRWEMGGSNNALYRMHGEQDQLREEIAAELKSLADLREKLRRIEQQL